MFRGLFSTAIFSPKGVEFWSLLNYVANVLLCTACLVHYVLLCCTCLVPCVLSCLTCLMFCVFSCITCFMFYMFSWLMCLVLFVLLCLSCNVLYVLSCLTCLVLFMYLCCTYSLVLRALVHCVLHPNITFSALAFPCFKWLFLFYFQLMTFFEKFTTVKIRIICRHHFEVTVSINQQYDVFGLHW